MHVVLRGSAQCYSEAAAAACLAAHESGAVCSSLPCHARPMEAQMLRANVLILSAIAMR